jgi:hypothetical protein
VFVPITPCRIFDTRPDSQVGPRSSPLGPNDTYTVIGRGATGDCTIPAAAGGLVLNVTSVGATAPTFLTIWPAGASRPTASSLNPSPGGPPTPNAVTTDLSDGGEFNLYNLAGSVHVLADVVGYYEDHNHDDRYYTKAESDAALDARVPQTQTMAVWTDAFTSDRGTDAMLRGYVNTSDGVGFIGAGGTNELSAPVHLPDGAVITSIVAHYLDNDDTANAYLNINFVCHEIPTAGSNPAASFDSALRLKSANSASDPASASFVTKPLTPFGGAPNPTVVDNSACAYGINVNAQNDVWTTTGPTVVQVSFLGVVITYDLPG